MVGTQIVLWMEYCDPGRLAANKVMLCTRNIFLLENMRDIFPEEYNMIISSSGKAGIIKEVETTIPCEHCVYSLNGKQCHQWINCNRYKTEKYISTSEKFDIQQWYKDYFRADWSAPDICNGNV